jgi:hypothetical protein
MTPRHRSRLWLIPALLLVGAALIASDIIGDWLSSGRAM